MQKGGTAGRSFSQFVAQLKETDAIYNTLQRFVGILQKVASYALGAAKGLLEFFGIKVEIEEGTSFIGAIAAAFEAFVQNPFISSGIDLLTRVKDAIVNFFTGLRDSEGFQKVTDKLTRLGNALAKIAGVVKNTFVRIIEGLGKALRGLFGIGDDVDLGRFSKLFNIGAVALIAQTIKKIYGMLTDLTTGKSPIATIKELFTSFTSIKDTISKAKQALSDFASGITIYPLISVSSSLSLLNISKYNI